MSQSPNVKPDSNANAPTSAPLSQSTNAPMRPTDAGPPTKMKNVFGDVIPVTEIRGITPEYATALKTIGINDTRQLYLADASKIAERLSVPRSTVEKFQQMAELLAVKAIEPQHAEILVGSNIGSIVSLRNANAADLFGRATKVQTALPTQDAGAPIAAADVDGWIRAAREHTPAQTAATTATAAPVAPRA
ncbi:MAG: DUF4332 domain-containing protein [Thermoplasmatota archaeon]